MMTFDNLLIWIIALWFLLGVLAFFSGVLILVRYAASGNVKTLAMQASKLAHKGLTDDIAGLVGNASKLLDAMNQLVRTTSGIGVFLTLLGLLMMGIASWLVFKL
jgi:hypothetical protein